eukprot:CAMPEP_0170515362 /NCGR_PEP_ID=MMETSP0209-20121228/1805_1 /TAXON_ID=665100 ORGANISM="Litonotus pictus, Strain P1" /NCGR_SAMPLE_ID=MMETSP0209 /ASSEMBLY_ACC=CAM_ASM_000301 /LENGTH=192 /DNA_ID=CAMNT_0010799809 /DNA_START=244 /DNA_END=819 /DNA_ORIENTATION=-
MENKELDPEDLNKVEAKLKFNSAVKELWVKCFYSMNPQKGELNKVSSNKCSPVPGLFYPFSEMALQKIFSSNRKVNYDIFSQVEQKLEDLKREANDEKYKQESRKREIYSEEIKKEVKESSILTNKPHNKIIDINNFNEEEETKSIDILEDPKEEEEKNSPRQILFQSMKKEYLNKSTFDIATTMLENDIKC